MPQFHVLAVSNPFSSVYPPTIGTGVFALGKTIGVSPTAEFEPGNTIALFADAAEVANNKKLWCIAFPVNFRFHIKVF